MNNKKNKKNYLIFNIYCILFFSFISLFNLKSLNKIFTKEEKIEFLNNLIKNYLNPNVRGFLNIIALLEGTLKKEVFYHAKKTKGLYLPSIDEYKILFGYKKFKNFNFHPNTVICENKLCSTAAGRYQILNRTFENSFEKIIEPKLDSFSAKKIKKKIKHIFYNLDNFYFNSEKDFKSLFKKPSDLYNISFNPFIQDLCAVALINENGAMELVKDKKYKEAIKKLSNIWASFPHKNSNKSFYKGQKSQNKEFVIKICDQIKKDLETFPEKVVDTFKKSEKFIGKVFNEIKEKIKFVK